MERENSRIYWVLKINKENLIAYRNDSIHPLANKIEAQNNKPKHHKFIYMNR